MSSTDTSTTAPLAPLVWFRIIFGALMAAEGFGASVGGWVKRAFVEPEHTFPMRGFEFLRVLSGEVMYGYYAFIGLASVGVMLGFRYRISATALAVLWSGAYLAQKSHYNNHYYLAALICWWMVFLPAHRQRSLDLRAGRVTRLDVCDAWVARLFRLQLLIVFSYAAIAKLYPGWLSGDYLRVNLGSKGDRWPLGWLVVKPGFQSFTVYAAILFDALVIPALMWKRTRPAAVFGLIGFNLFNSIVFRIGIFPYMVLGMLVFFYEDKFAASGEATQAASQNSGTARGLRTACWLYLAVQVLLPLRHHLIPGDVTWTEEGHRMSWRMMLRTKSGTIALQARSPSQGKRWNVSLKELVPRQAQRVATNPEFLYQFVQILKERYAASEGVDDLQVFVMHSAVSLNGTSARPLYEQGVDLAQATWRPGLEHDPWVRLRRD